MADCFSLQNAAAVVNFLRGEAKELSMLANGKTECNALWKAADVIEELVSKCNQLTTENRQLKAERDAAVAEIPKHCGTCRRFFKHEPCLDDADSCGWEWRGVTDANVRRKGEGDIT